MKTIRVGGFEIMRENALVALTNLPQFVNDAFDAGWRLPTIAELDYIYNLRDKFELSVTIAEFPTVLETSLYYATPTPTTNPVLNGISLDVLGFVCYNFRDGRKIGLREKAYVKLVKITG